jgi:hypothetical protein
MPVFVKGSRVEEKSDLMIGNKSDCGYDHYSISIYEILIVACPAHRLLCRLMQ